MRLWLTFALLLSACATGDTEFRVTRSPALPEGTTGGVSVFGVFRSGRIDPDYWEEIGPAVSQAFDWNSCETVFGERLQSADPTLFAHIDDEAKESGITPDLLSQVAPRAMGNLIMAMRVTGRLIDEQHAEHNLALANRPTGARAHESGFLGAGRAEKKANAAPAADPLELTLWLFSPRTHEIVAEVNMRYAGPSLPQALARFTDRVRTELPGLTCMGRKWDEAR